jgi:hypothetical protein
VSLQVTGDRVDRVPVGAQPARPGLGAVGGAEQVRGGLPVVLRVQGELLDAASQRVLESEQLGPERRLSGRRRLLRGHRVTGPGDVPVEQGQERVVVRAFAQDRGGALTAEDLAHVRRHHDRPGGQLQPRAAVGEHASVHVVEAVRGGQQLAERVLGGRVRVTQLPHLGDGGVTVVGDGLHRCRIRSESRVPAVSARRAADSRQATRPSCRGQVFALAAAGQGCASRAHQSSRTAGEVRARSTAPTSRWSQEAVTAARAARGR